MYNYVGPTWAERSFDPDGIEDTNLAKEWQLSCDQRLYPSTPPGTIADKLQKINNDRPTVWVYSDPWGDIPRLTGCSFSEYVSRDDWFDIWREANQEVLKRINALGVPVFLIAAHCDVIDCDFSNITVACPSWQKRMAHQLELVIDDTIVVEGRYIKHCIAQEIYFRYMHENPDVSIAPVLKDTIIDLWILWQKFHEHGIMYDNHPTKKSYQEFARYLKPMLTTWLENQ